MEWNRIIVGDCRDTLRTLPDGVFQTVVTSPPYWGLRDYGTAQWDGGDPACDHAMRVTAGATSQRVGRTYQQGMPHRDCHCGARRIDSQIGLEPTPDEFVDVMVNVFREVRRVLADDGALWLNLGDSYAGSWGNQGRKEDRGGQRAVNGPMFQTVDDERYPSRDSNTGKVPPGLKAKDLVGVPWRVAFALRDDGWYLRSDVIWAKPNPMPESVEDRPTKAHEYVFLMAKSSTYHYDGTPIREAQSDLTFERYAPGQTKTSPKKNADDPRVKSAAPFPLQVQADGKRNARSVWSIPTAPYAGAHFATFPPALAQRCILATSRIGDGVLDPFFGTGTVGEVAESLGRRWVGLELNPRYAALAARRTAQMGLPFGGGEVGP